jgi:hypothetical protein
MRLLEERSPYWRRQLLVVQPGPPQQLHIKYRSVKIVFEVSLLKVSERDGLTAQ